MKNSRENNLKFYKGRRVLVTGHTGFKGSWLTLILKHFGADAVGYALPPPEDGLYQQIDGNTHIKNVTGDLTDRTLLGETIREFQPEVVLHLAAYCIVEECFEDPVRAYASNVLGTVHLLEALRECPSVRSIVVVSTDKVYQENADHAPYKETDPIGNTSSPYCSSKSCAEFAARDYWNSFFKPKQTVGMAVTRAGNVIAGGEHTKSRIINCILTALDKREPVALRHPEQLRHWQSVLDVLDGYLTIGRLLYEDPKRYSEAWNIASLNKAQSVLWLMQAMQQHFSELTSTRGKHLKASEEEVLELDISKALGYLDWEPRLSCEQAVQNVADFYKRQKAGEEVCDICLRQIKNYYRSE
jgi:CDP-glucose 4,6-dehydratase